MVFVEGIAQANFKMDAFWVFVFGAGGFRSIGEPPKSITDYIYGSISAINPDLKQFTVWVNAFQGESRPVTAIPGAVYLDAPLGGDIDVISFADLQIDDPIMIHGYKIADHLKGIIFVRSEDWRSLPLEREPELIEIYGWIEDKWKGPNGEEIIQVYIDTLSGDPNHQTFSAVIGVDGGRFNFPWGYLDFPQNAVDGDTQISVSGDFMFWWTLQNIYDFLPGMEFNYPVDIELRYFNLPDGINPEMVSLSYYDEDLGKWRIASHMDHFEGEHCFRGSIQHFSRYSLSSNNRPLKGLIRP